MKKILCVEDDTLVARICRQKLTEAGFDVFVAGDGMEAMKFAVALKPALVVLDIVIPRLSGLDVLRFLRQEPALKDTRVVVFSSPFIDDTAERIAELGVDELLLKSVVNPDQLVHSVIRILASHPAPLPAASDVQTSLPNEWRRESPSDFGERIRRDFFNQLPAIRSALDQVSKDFLAATTPAEQTQTLGLLTRKIGFLTQLTGMAGCHRIAQLSSVFEELLFQLNETPAKINESTLHTTESTVALLSESLSRADQADEQCLSPTAILVVDDDAVSNRALYLALSRYRLSPTFALDPFVALKKARQTSYDIVLLDINLPGMDGINMCEQMRKLPLHQHTPVIFITSHMEFEPRARSILRAGDDLIMKPILPVELTVKVIANSLRRRLKLDVSTPA
ncbi:MAG TPA: response regulator [Candidatus Paceibacterota bacterium]|nr:response regulator [Candidatus Paceibacterota bacterium]